MPGVPRVWSLPLRRPLAGLALAIVLLAAPAAALDLEVIDTATGRRVEPGGVIDLATVRAGAVGQRVFRVVNREAGPLAVDGEGFQVTRQPPTVEPGRDGTFHIGLAGQPGTAKSLVVVRNVDTGKPVLEFYLRARVVAESEPPEEPDEEPAEETGEEAAPP